MRWPPLPNDTAFADSTERAKCFNKGCEEAHPRSRSVCGKVRSMVRASFALVILSLVPACKTPTQPPVDSSTSAPEGKGPTVKPEVASEVLANMDAAANPCDDFYRYACVDGSTAPSCPRTSHGTAGSRRFKSATKMS